MGKHTDGTTRWGVDLVAAKRAREYKTSPHMEAYYASQKHMADQWQPGEKPPEGLRLAEEWPPEVNTRAIRVEREEI